MVKYTCETSNKEFTRKLEYTKHIRGCNKPVLAFALQDKVYRLNYIGSKFQLLDRITGIIKDKTGWTTFAYE